MNSPSNFDRKALLATGKNLMRTGQLTEAGRIFDRILERTPLDTEAHFSLGNTLKDLGRLDDAVARYEKAISIKHDYFEVHFNLGNTLKDLGRLGDAVASYEKAISIKSDYAGAYNNLGNALIDLGKFDEAVVCFKKVLSIKPDLRSAQHILDGLLGNTTECAPREHVEAVFNSYAVRFDDHLTNTLGYKIPTLMRQAVDALPDGSGTFPLALDLGCGTGMVAENFQGLTGEIDGVDLSPKMLVQAEAKGVYANLYLADVLEFLEGSDVRPAGYDLIVSADTFIYIGKLDGIFAAARRALTDCGLFVISVEHLEDGDFKLLPSSRYSQSDAYIERLAAESGFAVVRHDPVTVRIEMEGPIPGRIFVLGAAG